jgi:hypothetical protein
MDPESVLEGTREIGNAEPGDVGIAVSSDRAVRVVASESAANVKDLEDR